MDQQKIAGSTWAGAQFLPVRPGWCVVCGVPAPRSLDALEEIELEPDTRYVWPTGEYVFATADGGRFGGVGEAGLPGVRDQLHSWHGEPAVIWPNGALFWYRRGALHRDNGPAVMHSNGASEWWRDGVLSRDDGPAAIWPDRESIEPPMRGVAQFWRDGVMVGETVPPAAQRARDAAGRGEAV
jgi:hypothetical protein